MPTWTDSKCGATVRGNDQHCPGCHRTFANTAAGDAHRDGPFDARVCVDPATIRRVDPDTGDDLGPLMDLDQHGAWRIIPTEAQRAAQERFIEKKRQERERAAA